MSEVAKSIRETIKEASNMIWEQLFDAYESHLTPNKWVDTNNVNGGIISNCEALVALFMLKKNFENQIKPVTEQDLEHLECIANTIAEIVPDSMEISNAFKDGKPYIDPDRNPFFKDFKQPLTETIYMIGNVLFYYYTIVSNTDKWVEFLKSPENLEEKVAKKLISLDLEDLLDTCIVHLKNHMQKDIEKTPGWGFVPIESENNVMQYFTFNAIAFSSLLFEKEYKDKFRSVSRIEEGVFSICDWYRKEFLDRLYNEVVDFQVVGDNGKHLYNNAYVLCSLSLMGFYGTDDENISERFPNPKEYLDKLGKAVKFLAKHLDLNFSDYKLTSKVRDPNQFEFPLNHPDIDPISARDKGLYYDDRTIIPLVLICLSRYGSLRLEELDKNDPDRYDTEIDDYIGIFFRRLWESRSTQYESKNLWDNNVKPSIFYTMRAVDAITEVYNYCQMLYTEKRAELMFETQSVKSEGVHSQLSGFDYDRFSESLTTAFKNTNLYALSCSVNKTESKKWLEEAKAHVIQDIENRLQKDVEIPKYKDDELLPKIKDVVSDEIAPYAAMQNVVIEWLSMITRLVGSTKKGCDPNALVDFLTTKLEDILSIDGGNIENLESLSNEISRLLGKNGDLENPVNWTKEYIDKIKKTQS